MRRTLREHPAVAAGGVAAGALYGLEVILAGATARQVWAVGPALALVGGSAALGRNAPVTALGGFGLGYAVQTAVTGPVDSFVVLVVWMLLLASCSRWRTGSALAAGAVLGAVPLAVFGAADGTTNGPGSLALYALPLLCGRALRNRDEKHGAELALLRAEQDRDVANERAMLADDVHDLLGHALVSIVVQARSAAAELPSNANRSRDRLTVVEQVGRDALTELRCVVSRLAAGSRSLTDEPGIDALDGLLARMPVQAALVVDPAVATTSGEVQGCVYLVVKESMTNAVRHSAACAVEIEVRREADAVVVDVVDPGPPIGGTAGSGRGLQSMHRRVTALGGTLTVAADDAGFAVHARLPLQRTP